MVQTIVYCHKQESCEIDRSFQTIKNYFLGRKKSMYIEIMVLIICSCTIGYNQAAFWQMVDDCIVPGIMNSIVYEGVMNLNDIMRAFDDAHCFIRLLWSSGRLGKGVNPNITLNLSRQITMFTKF